MQATLGLKLELGQVRLVFEPQVDRHAILDYFNLTKHTSWLCGRGAGAVLLDSSLIPSPPIMPQDRARVDDCVLSN